MSTPGPASRRVSDMSLEQLYRKRAIDRENQRNLRNKNKTKIAELEAELQLVRDQLAAAEKRGSHLESQLSTAKSTINSVVGTLQSIPLGQQTPEWLAAPSKAEDQTPMHLDADSCLPFADVGDLDAQFWVDGGHLTFPLDGSEVCNVSDFSLDLNILAPPTITESHAFQQLASQGESLNANTVVQQETPPESTHAINDEFYSARLEATRLRSENPVWAATPQFTPPTCTVDHLIISLIETRKVHHQFNSDMGEFSHKNFPSVSSLLNPSLAEPDEPVASTIAKHVAGVIRIQTLPEKLALLYIMCVLIRWHVLPTEEHYYAIPEFARPTACQIASPYPPWVGTIGWPKARDRIISHMDFTQYPKFAGTITKSFSVNWPYNLAGILEGGGAGREFRLTDAFIAHIKNVNHWTVGKELVEKFPFLDGAVNVKI